MGHPRRRPKRPLPAADGDSRVDPVRQEGAIVTILDPIPDPPDLDFDLDVPIPFDLAVDLDLDGPIPFWPVAATNDDDGLGLARGCANMVAFWIVLAILAALVLWGRPLLAAVWRMILP